MFRPVFKHFHYDLDHSPIVGTIQKTFGYKHSTLVLVAVLLLAYALIELVEAGGLWYAKRWAEYLTVVATAAFLPLEIYELTEHISWLKIATLVLNILAVLYIALAKRLFGLRGGRKAFDEERESASLLEVETSMRRHGLTPRSTSSSPTTGSRSARSSCPGGPARPGSAPGPPHAPSPGSSPVDWLPGWRSRSATSPTARPGTPVVG